MTFIIAVVYPILDRHT